MKKILLFILVTLFAISTYSQQNKFKERKNIYLLDVTLSMWGHNGAPNIFDNVRDELIKSISAIQNPNTEIVIVTFQDAILETWSDYATNVGKDKIISKLKAIDPAKLDLSWTNIYSAWKEGRRLVDSNKFNVIYLLTDGVHNSPKSSKKDLYKEVEDWGSFSENKNAYAFLVELVDEARDEDLRGTINSTPNAQVISDMNFFVFSIKDNAPIINLHEKLEFELDFIGDRIEEIPNNLELIIEMNDENFTLSKEMFRLNEKPIAIQLIPSKELDLIKAAPQTEWYSSLSITFDEGKYPNVKILDNKIKLKVKNKKEMVLNIKFLEN